MAEVQVLQVPHEAAAHPATAVCPTQLRQDAWVNIASAAEYLHRTGHTCAARVLAKLGLGH